jgi:hypothetical protein
MDWAGRTIPLAHSVPLYNLTGFFFWSYAKDQFFRPQVGSVVELRARINNEVASLTPPTLENIWHEIEYRLDILRATNGAHIEMYWTRWVVLTSRADQFSASHILCFVWPPCILVCSTETFRLRRLCSVQKEDYFEWWIMKEAIYYPSIC